MGKSVTAIRIVQWDGEFIQDICEFTPKQAFRRSGDFTSSFSGILHDIIMRNSYRVQVMRVYEDGTMI